MTKCANRMYDMTECRPFSSLAHFVIGTCLLDIGYSSYTTRYDSFCRKVAHRSPATGPQRAGGAPEPRTLRPAPGPACAGDARSGVTLVELLIAMAILALVAVGLRQVVGAAVSSFSAARKGQDLLANGRFAMERIAFFAQESEGFVIPASNTLQVVERVLDVYDNTTHAYAPAGDGLLDADNDSNRRVNADILFDPPEYVIFTHDSLNNVLRESLPNYSTALLNDQSDAVTICEFVKNVTFSLLATNLVQIEMTLNDGQNEVVLQTRAKARMVNQ